MDSCKAFLDKTYSLFNWELSEIDVNHTLPKVVKLKEKIEEKDNIGDASSDDKWPLKLTYGYELFTEDAVEAEKVVNEAVEEIKTSKEHLNVKYRVPFLHIALSTKACMILKCKNRLKEVEKLVDSIKSVTAMTNEEVSGLLAMKAQIYRYYGPDGTNKSTTWLREAVRKNPKEVEWKISLVITFNRKRHFFKGVECKWEDVEESVNILEEVLCDPKLTVKQVVMCKYYLAVAYHDYTMGKNPSADVDECKREILRLCEGFYNKTDHPQYVTFAAERFAQSNAKSEKRKAMEIIDKFLEKFPNHIGVLITACKILKRQGDFSQAAKHAKVALDLGGYGAAWLLLECRVKMGHHVDAEEYFNSLLSQFQDMFKKQTHLSASLFYFFSRQDPVNGARHFHQALIEDPDYDLLRKPNYCSWVRKYNYKFIPMEIAYNQVVLALRSNHSREDTVTLSSTKRKIEEVFDVRKFNISQNLVQKALGDSRPQNRFSYNRR